MKKEQKMIIGSRAELDRRLLKGAKPIVKQVTPPVQNNEHILDLINHWNNLGLRPCKEGTKGFEEAYVNLTRLRRGTLYNTDFDFDQYHNRKFTEEEIMVVFEKFSLAATNSDYIPSDKKNLMQHFLPRFLFNPHVFSEFTKSQFLHWFKEEPVKIEKELYPEITIRLIKRYNYEVLGRTDAKTYEKDRMKFIKGANRMRKFLIDNQILKNLPFKVTSVTIADWLFDAVHGRSFNILYPGHFCSDYTFDNIVPDYLMKQGLMEKGEFKGRGL